MVFFRMGLSRKSASCALIEHCFWLGVDFRLLHSTVLHQHVKSPASLLASKSSGNCLSLSEGHFCQQLSLYLRWSVTSLSSGQVTRNLTSVGRWASDLKGLVQQDLACFSQLNSVTSLGSILVDCVLELHHSLVNCSRIDFCSVSDLSCFLMSPSTSLNWKFCFAVTCFDSSGSVYRYLSW